MGLFLPHTQKALRHRPGVIGVYSILERHLLCYQCTLLIGHLGEVLLIDLLLHLGWGTTQKAHQLLQHLIMVQTTIVAGIVRLCILLIHPLVVLIKWPHISAPKITKSPMLLASFLLWRSLRHAAQDRTILLGSCQRACQTEQEKKKEVRYGILEEAF